MTKLYSLNRIKDAFQPSEAIAAIRQGFSLLAQGKMHATSPTTVDFAKPPGIAHIKGGYISNGHTYVIKVASYFPENAEEGISPIQGLFLIFDKRSGAPQAILADEGYLTYARTAAAGAVCAAYLAPQVVRAIGILGTGKQARVQLRYLKEVTECRNVFIWGRNAAHAQTFANEATALGFSVHIAASAKEVAANCNLIVTATSATEPLLQAGDIRKGTHITAIGADHPQKVELAPSLIARADSVVVDSLASELKGDTSHALAQQLINPSSLVELGQVITRQKPGRQRQDDITIADLTGVGVQDVQIATLVAKKLEKNR